MSNMSILKTISIFIMIFSYSICCNAQEGNLVGKPLTPEMASFIQGNWCLDDYKTYYIDIMRGSNCKNNAELKCYSNPYDSQDENCIKNKQKECEENLIKDLSSIYDGYNFKFRISHENRSIYILTSDRNTMEIWKNLDKKGSMLFSSKVLGHLPGSKGLAEKMLIYGIGQDDFVINSISIGKPWLEAAGDKERTKHINSWRFKKISENSIKLTHNMTQIIHEFSPNFNNLKIKYDEAHWSKNNELDGSYYTFKKCN